MSDDYVNLPDDASGWVDYVLEDFSAPWREFAECREEGVNMEDFFPENVAAPRIDKGRATRRARFVCAPCPVKRACLEMGLKRNAEGIWAATTAEQRRPYVKKLRGHLITLSEALSALAEIGRASATTGSYGPADPSEWVDVA